MDTSETRPPGGIRHDGAHAARAECVSGLANGVSLGSINMKSPLIDLKEETLPALSPEDYADPVAINMRIFRSLQAYLGIIRASA
jgi:hypothetical protein